MTELEALFQRVFSDRDIRPEDVPRLDLYMDQILALFDAEQSTDARASGEKPLTKTMVHNYLKEGLLSPVKGKKYSRQQIMQLLCVYQLKQTLPLSDIKALTGRDDVDFLSCYSRLLQCKDELRTSLPPQLLALCEGDPASPDGRLSLCLSLSAIATYARRLCQQLIDDAVQ